MCELLAISSRVPTQVGFSLGQLVRHGGVEGPHRDGWGVAYYQGEDVLRLREAQAASDSPLARLIERSGPPSPLVMGHIRLATQGKPALCNTQPFLRELAGRSHLFAHNGDLEGIAGFPIPRSARFRPIGDTDSERAFCHLLDGLTPLWLACEPGMPPLNERLDYIAEFAARLRPLGPANFLYADGDVLFIHAHRRKQPDGRNVPPGLHLLQRSCQEVPPETSGQGVSLFPSQQQVVLVASVPLTDEPWVPLGAGEILAVRRGEILERRS